MDDHLKQLLLLGREHYQNREYEKAEYLLRQVADKADQFADIHHMLGVITHSRGDFAEAERHFERAVQINPNYTEAQLNLMVTYNDLGKYDEARRLYAEMRSRGQEKGRELDPFAKGKIANMHAELSQAYQDMGMTLDAIRELEKATALCPTFADLLTQLGVLYRDSGDIVRAREKFEAAKAANPKYIQARLLYGVLLLSGGENENAKSEFEAVLALDPDNKSAHTYLRIAKNPKKSEAPPAQGS
ncbi:MAG: tetratricopeptide repeat protein [Polyangiaceae bacterium]